MTRLIVTSVDETAALLASKLSDLIDRIDTLNANLDAVEGLLGGIEANQVTANGHLATSEGHLNSVVTKLGGGLPAALTNPGRLKVATT